MRGFKMKILWAISLMVGLFEETETLYYLSWYPWLIRYHYPGRFTTQMTQWINGTDTKIAPRGDTPDYRIEEPHFSPVSKKYLEHERPYRNSPAYKNYYYFGRRGYGSQRSKTGKFILRDTSSFIVSALFWWLPLLILAFRNCNGLGIWLMYRMGCYCCTVYKRLTLLSTCAVITSRHVVTTATPTLLIINSYRHLKHLEDILGGWYDVDYNTFNSSMYFTPSRIHFHPEYTYPHEVNVSHPIPAMFDLAIWAATHTFYKGYWWPRTEVMMCGRAGSGRFHYVSTIPNYWDNGIVAGFQFIKSYKRRPMPWFRYVVFTKAYVFPCPKSDWQWYHCIMGELWARLGFDSGGGMNSGYDDRWRYDGLAGVCAFSLKLRSKQIVHYFTVVDTYPVLDFFYDAFLGLIKPVWLDGRFEDTKWAAPVAYEGEWFQYHYEFGRAVAYDIRQYPFYRRR